MNPRLRAEIAAVLVLGGATVLVAWPWLFGGELFPQRDAAFSMVAVQHLQRIALGEVPWDSATLGWPLRPGLIQADWMVGQALLGLPLSLAGLGMIQVYMLLVLAGLFATAWAGHRVAQALVGPGPHTWLAGAVAGLGPLQLAHAPHLNLVHHELVLGGGLLLALGLATNRPARAALGAVLLGASFHLGIYMGLHAALAGTAVLLGAILTRRVRWPVLAAALGAGLLALATVVPVLVIYSRFATLHHAGLGHGELAGEAWDLAETLRPVAGAWLHDLLPTSWARYRGQDPPNLGYATSLLAALGLLPAWRRGWAWRAVTGAGIAAALLALGPAPAWNHHPLGGPGPLAFLYDLMDQPSLRAPGRWLWLSSVAVGLLASLALARLGRRLGPRLAILIGLAGVLVVVAEAPHATTVPRQSLRPPAVYRALAELPPGPLLEHFSNKPTAHRDEAIVSLMAALRHHRPLVGGHWARSSPTLADLNGLMAAWPAAQAVEAAGILGVAAVIEHPPLSGMPPAGTNCRLLGGFRLCALEPVFPQGLPEGGAVSPLGDGPVVGLRFVEPPLGRRLELRCPARPPWRTTVGIWKTLARLRSGPEAEGFDVFLPRPCSTAPIPGEGRAVPLFATRTPGSAG